MTSVEQTYRKLSDIDHCLARPAMWIGSTKLHTATVFLSDASGKYVPQENTFSPAFLKIFDEIISNSADEHRREGRKLRRIDVIVNRETGRIVIKDDGGIPVIKHKEYNLWIPELIFSELKAGSNFDDNEKRLVAGTNGVGSTLTNIFSREFRVRTCDGKMIFDQTFSNNMRERTEPIVAAAPAKQTGFTEISYVPDFPRFSLTGLDDVHIELLRKRCIDTAGCNPRLIVSFNGEVFSFPKFIDYCRMYVDTVIYETSDRWKVAVTDSSDGFQQISFVNGVETRDGGTHVDHIVSQIVDHVRRKLEKKHKIDLKPSDIKQHLTVFVQAEIENPGFTSQTKEKLITEPREFGSTHKLSDKMLKLIIDSPVVSRIVDWIQQKVLAQERAQLRALNKTIEKGKVLKLIDAKSRVDRASCSLALFEGDSASSAFRKYRDPATQGAFPLRGKFVNVSEVPSLKVVQNQEVRELLTAIGLKFGEPPVDLRYGKILIYSDADPDGDSIAGLLINFFGRFWPEMFDSDMIRRVVTPIVVAQQSTTKLSFYTQAEFDDWAKDRTDFKKWEIEFKKGLAALDDGSYKDIIQNPKYFIVKSEGVLKSSLDTWFGDDVSLRKEKILTGVAEVKE